jgi:hypothetical protein
MKLNRATVSMVIAAAVIVLAYFAGMVFREARLSRTPPAKPVRQQASQQSAEERAKIKAAKEKKLEESRHLSPEEQEQARQAVIKRVTPPSQADGNAAVRRSLTPDEIRARQERMRGRSPQTSMPAGAEPNAARTPPAKAATDPNAKIDASTKDAKHP